MIRIVKLGGSLLDWPDFPTALARWLSQQPPALDILIAGGGQIAETIRKADRDFELGEELSHWLCIDAMSISARIVVAAMRGMPLLLTFAELRSEAAMKRQSAVVFDPGEFLAEHESLLPGRPLPHDWSVTSDSIAARLAETLAADELVLLKSAELPSESLAELAAQGYVDRYFPVAAAKLRQPRFVTLHATAF
jgi:aspartokinase-like uncharacterized kinase